ncbi:MAG: hypothetical protein H5T44_06440, partial [Thermoplasmatales archaeon]|nr:hypothetical protein [Thermoplasmatales archaeon]
MLEDIPVEEKLAILEGHAEIEELISLVSEPEASSTETFFDIGEKEEAPAAAAGGEVEDDLLKEIEELEREILEAQATAAAGAPGIEEELEALERELLAGGGETGTGEPPAGVVREVETPPAAGETLETAPPPQEAPFTAMPEAMTPPVAEMPPPAVAPVVEPAAEAAEVPPVLEAPQPLDLLEKLVETPPAAGETLETAPPPQEAPFTAMPEAMTPPVAE